MLMFKRQLIGTALLALLPWVTTPGQAQTDFPNKPIRFIVGYAAGGPTDVIARMVAQEITGPLGQSVVVENRALRLMATPSSSTRCHTMSMPFWARAV
jgi:tripartite-type tricarboxylate transporter receptor subunit TctC